MRKELIQFPSLPTKCQLTPSRARAMIITVTVKDQELGPQKGIIGSMLLWTARNAELRRGKERLICFSFFSITIFRKWTKYSLNVTSRFPPTLFPHSSHSLLAHAWPLTSQTPNIWVKDYVSGFLEGFFQFHLLQSKALIPSSFYFIPSLNRINNGMKCTLINVFSPHYMAIILTSCLSVFWNVLTPL